MYTEAAAEQFVGGHEFALKICRNEKKTDHAAGNDVAEDDLQVCKASAQFRPHESRVGERRYSNEGQSTGFGGDNRKADDNPGNIPGAQKVVLNGSLRLTE